MLLTNEHIKLRALEPEDLELIYKWENDSRWWTQGNTLAPYSRSTLRRYINETQQTDIYESKQLRLMITLQATDVTVGIIDIYDFDLRNSRAGIGILIDDNYRNKGLALQALNLLKGYAFDFLRLHQLYALIAINNEPSRKLFTNAGYKEAGMLKDWVAQGLEFEDVVLVQIMSYEE
jgi:diamine N-acetyltransferase